jgi:hypothetical protein
MATTPDIDIVNALDGLSDTGWKLTRGTNLFEGPSRAPDAQIPHACVFVLATGGAGPQAYADGTTTKLRYSSVQITIRSAPRTFATWQTAARAIRDDLHNVSISGYLDVRAQQSEPVYLGEDEDGHHEWTVNLELVHEQ